MSQDPAELRRAVRHFLYVRSSVARSAASIARALKAEHSCTEDQVESACRFLLDLGQVASETDPLGGEVFYRITAAGQLAQERDPHG
jgi:hypothetical protein